MPKISGNSSLTWEVSKSREYIRIKCENIVVMEMDFTNVDPQLYPDCQRNLAKHATRTSKEVLQPQVNKEMAIPTLL